MPSDARTRRFELLAMPHLDAAFNLARWLTGNTTDAEDVVQDAYLRAFRYFDAFHGGNFRVWLLTIVRNSFLDWVKDNRSPRLVFQPVDDADDAHADPQPNAEAMLLEQVDQATLTTLVGQLPAEYREVLILREIEDLSYKEISAVTGVPAGTVMSRLSPGSAGVAQGVAGVAAMNHARVLPYLQAYADNEVSLLRRFWLRRHIERCPSCLAELEVLGGLHTALRTKLAVHRAPPALASRIASALPREAVPVTRSKSVWVAGGGGALAGALAGVALTLLLSRQPDALIADAVDDHVRSLMADHLTDVTTSDQHTVKPWLSARLALSPEVKDLAAQGYPLIGGRLDYVDGHQAAALVYGRAKHIINLFVFVTGDVSDKAPVQRSRDGFNVVEWRMGGLTYVAVSDVEMAQLLSFADMIR